MVDVSQYRSADVPSVMPDNRLIGRMAARHLTERGLRHFGFVADGKFAPLIERLDGFRRELAGHGFGCEVFWSRSYASTSWWEQEQEDARVIRWLDDADQATGIMAGSDSTAAQVMRALAHGGIQVPDQVCVVGVHDDPMIVALTRPALSSVRTGCDRVGMEAARLLAALLAGHRPPSKPIEIAPLEVVVRGSSDVFAVDDPLVRQALSKLRENAAGNFDINLLAQKLGVSRRTIERRFSRQLARTPADELRRLRFEMAKHLLRETSLPVEDVACRCGFASATRLGEAMRKRLGTTPALYRRHARVDCAPHTSSHHT